MPSFRINNFFAVLFYVSGVSLGISYLLTSVGHTKSAFDTVSCLVIEPVTSCTYRQSHVIDYWATGWPRAPANVNVLNVYRFVKRKITPVNVFRRLFGICIRPFIFEWIYIMRWVRWGCWNLLFRRRGLVWPEVLV